MATCKLVLQEAAPSFSWDLFCVGVVLEVTLPETGVQEQAWVGKVVGTCEGQCREEMCGVEPCPSVAGGQDSSLAGALSIECFCHTVMI